MLDKYSDPNRELAISFNLLLPDNVEEYIKHLQSEARTKTTELRHYDTSPHLAIATKFMPIRLTDKFIDCINNEFKNQKPFEIHFDSLTIAETKNYIFIEPSQETKDYINQLRIKALEVSKDIGFETPKNQPARFEYIPHISIIKCSSENIDAVFNHLEKNLKEVSGTVNTLYINKEQRNKDGYAEFPRVLTLQLE